DEGCLLIDTHCQRTLHEEMNAILQCSKFGVPTEGAEIYVTHYPCIQCCKSIIQAGIKTVYYAEDYKTQPYAKELFSQAGVKVEQVELDEMIIDLKNREKLSFVAGLIQQLSDAGVKADELKKIHEQANELFTSYV
ncbi:deaminase, partial [Bacillus velezensis]